jgi:hypothetical protein
MNRLQELALVAAVIVVAVLIYIYGPSPMDPFPH